MVLKGFRLILFGFKLMQGGLCYNSAQLKRENVGIYRDTQDIEGYVEDVGIYRDTGGGRNPAPPEAIKNHRNS